MVIELGSSIDVDGIARRLSLQRILSKFFQELLLLWSLRWGLHQPDICQTKKGMGCGNKIFILQSIPFVSPQMSGWCWGAYVLYHRVCSSADVARYVPYHIERGPACTPVANNKNQTCAHRPIKLLNNQSAV